MIFFNFWIKLVLQIGWVCWEVVEVNLCVKCSLCISGRWSQWLPWQWLQALQRWSTQAPWHRDWVGRVEVVHSAREKNSGELTFYLSWTVCCDDCSLTLLNHSIFVTKFFSLFFQYKWCKKCCKYKMGENSEMKIHIKICEGDHSCLHCGQHFKKALYRDEHETFCALPPDPCLCRVCLGKSHNRDSGHFQCPRCFLRSTNKNSIRYHYFNLCESKHKCEQHPDDTFNTVDAFLQHRRQKHGFHKCPVCPAKYWLENQLCNQRRTCLCK